MMLENLIDENSIDIDRCDIETIKSLILGEPNQSHEKSKVVNLNFRVDV
jgi:hypothetical protein